jgi:hypothetical protein
MKGFGNANQRTFGPGTGRMMMFTVLGRLRVLRGRLSYANVMASLALFFAMSGGALAASHYLITSPKQIKPSVLKSLKGANGAKGANGSAGPAGQPGRRERRDPRAHREPRVKTGLRALRGRRADRDRKARRGQLVARCHPARLRRALGLSG